MTRLYRILREAYAQAPFDGEGAYRYGGRWSSAGTRLSYTSEHQSLAMLEYFVHLDDSDAPEDLVLAAIDVPDSVSRERIELSALPSHWRNTPPPSTLARFGDKFAKEEANCILVVPSVLSPSENNWLINPRHTDFKKIIILPCALLHYDSRMFKAARRRRTHSPRPKPKHSRPS
ncbi:MAG TPA: RES domain-containing protein [Candidatus Sulfotelmatobacter sp.]